MFLISHLSNGINLTPLFFFFWLHEKLQKLLPNVHGFLLQSYLLFLFHTSWKLRSIWINPRSSWTHFYFHLGHTGLQKRAVLQNGLSVRDWTRISAVNYRWLNSLAMVRFQVLGAQPLLQAIPEEGRYATAWIASYVFICVKQRHITDTFCVIWGAVGPTHKLTQNPTFLTRIPKTNCWNLNRKPEILIEEKDFALLRCCGA